MDMPGLGLERLAVRVVCVGWHVDDAGDATPPALAAVALFTVFFDQADSRQDSQVVTGRAAPLAELGAELGGRRGAVSEHIQDPEPQGVRDRPHLVATGGVDGTRVRQNKNSLQTYFAVRRLRRQAKYPLSSPETQEQATIRFPSRSSWPGVELRHLIAL